MRYFSARILGLVLCLCLVSTGYAQGTERRVTRYALPPAVRDALDKESVGAKLRGLSEEQENGVTRYEAELRINGLSKDVVIDKDGNVVEIEEEVGFESLPPAVKKTLLARTDKSKIMSVERLTRHGALVAYEARVRSGVKRIEIQVAPDGRLLGPPSNAD